LGQLPQRFDFLYFLQHFVFLQQLLSCCAKIGSADFFSATIDSEDIDLPRVIGWQI
jgi:hypothetical protein